MLFMGTREREREREIQVMKVTYNWQQLLFLFFFLETDLSPYRRPLRWAVLYYVVFNRSNELTRNYKISPPHPSCIGISKVPTSFRFNGIYLYLLEEISNSIYVDDKDDNSILSCLWLNLVLWCSLIVSVLDVYFSNILVRLIYIEYILIF